MLFQDIQGKEIEFDPPVFPNIITKLPVSSLVYSALSDCEQPSDLGSRTFNTGDRSLASRSSVIAE